jgi:peptide/nickel transport system permease protein
MLRFVIRRVLSGLLMLLALTIVTYAVFFTIPENPGTYLTGIRTTPAKLAAADKVLGVDKPVYVQYLRFLRGLLEGHLGNSYASQEPVATIIRQALPVTASIVLGGALLMVVVALVIGIGSALHPHTLLDRTLNTLIMCGVALHPLVVGLLLQSVFVYSIPLAPAGGYCSLTGPGACGFQEWAAHLLLPWITFMLFLLPLYARVIRARVLDLMQQPHVAVARAKGASEREVIRWHVLRLLVPTLATMLALDVSTSLMAAIYIEAAFNLPGIGTQALTAQVGFNGLDLPVIVGIVTVVATTVIVLNVVADIVAARADPRIVIARDPGSTLKT